MITGTHRQRGPFFCFHPKRDCLILLLFFLSTTASPQYNGDVIFIFFAVAFMCLTMCVFCFSSSSPSELNVLQ